MLPPPPTEEEVEDIISFPVNPESEEASFTEEVTYERFCMEGDGELAS